MNCEYEDKVFSVQQGQFEELALEIYRFQYQHNPLYQQYVKSLPAVGARPASILDIPFLPIRFFKSRDIKTGNFEPEVIFESSGTTGSVNSRHLVKKLSLYRRTFLTGWREFYADPSGYCIIGLLPSYLERQNSSLVLMVDELIKASGHPDSGFYLYEHDRLAAVLQKLEAAGQKTMLIGVTFALLDFADQYPMPLVHTSIMETGGMKGRRAELTREQVHDRLKKAFQCNHIHAEYGMTELLSQAYAEKNGLFRPMSTMNILVREEDDPFAIKKTGRGIINVIDLSNIYSCAFIATDDLGHIHPDGSFEVIGRVDNSDIRGCSQLV